MQIELKNILLKGTDTEDFSFSYSAPNSLVDIPFVEFNGDVKVDGYLTIISKHEVRVVANITYSLKGNCSRCGDNAETVIETDIDEQFCDAEIEDCYTFSKGVVDITKSVNDKIVMSMPMQVLCSTECKGLCPICNHNLNQGDCSCKNL